MIFVVDFGGQTAHLIKRRLRDLGVEAILIDPDIAYAKSKKEKPAGIILSGGPMSVYEKNAPTVNENIFALNIPLLGICYGFQEAAHLLGGKVISGRKEYGPASFKVLQNNSQILKGVAKDSTVWMSHGDEIVAIPKEFTLIGSTPHVPNTAAEDKKRKLYMIQFHPEVEHTLEGIRILQNFIEICNVEKKEQNITPEEMIANIKSKVGDARVIGAVSGGVDSTVAATLVARAIGKKFTPIFVNNGLMRSDAVESVKSLFKPYKITPVIIEVEKEMLRRLKGVTDSEEKRKVIGNFYIEIFEKEMKRLVKTNSGYVKFLLQGTIFSDVIESQGSKHASKIKSHHNVGGLPKTMQLELLEPLREMYKDEVRALGKALGLPSAFVQKQPFPGPGFAVRIRGEVTKERLVKEKHADEIVMEEVKKAGWLSKVFISFPVMTGAESTAVKGDGKFMGEVIALRVVESKDIMTSTWAHLPYEILQKISSRIVNEIPGISRVVYDITTKPPATMEWE